MLSKGKEVMSYSSYVYYFPEFAEEIQIRRPRKDVCNTCIKYRNSVLNGDNEKWHQHLEEARKRTNIYEKDIQLAKRNQTDDIPFLMISLAIPKLASKHALL